MTLTINKKKYDLNVDEDMPLLWVIRDVVNLKGTKYGCGVGDCGACMVLLDGNAIRSCSIPARTAVDKEIITIEGIEETKYSVLQSAWIEEDVAQCGYCQPGQIISATALLKSKPKPSQDDIDKAMAGNLCRCGTYQRIQKAILKASKMKR